MKRKPFTSIAFFVLTLLSGVEVLHGQHLETDRFADVRDRVVELKSRHRPEAILLVFDVDNTLLAMNQPLGSDQWFNWQESLLTSEPNSRHLVAESFTGLLNVQGLLFAISSMHPPEPAIPELVEEMQSYGCACIVLTSRGDDFRNATLRELNSNGYAFSDSAVTIDEPIRGPFAPFDEEDPARFGLTPEIVEQLGTPRDVSYARGVMMVAGQHKGYMLKTLLARSDQHFTAIVFVDDHEKHTTRMRQAFSDADVELVTVRYSREDAHVKSFHASDKRELTRQWRRLSRTIDNLFSKPMEPANAGGG